MKVTRSRKRRLSSRSQETDENQIKISPQPGPQSDFLSTTADIAIYGGAAGGGKSYALLIEPLRHYENKHFSGVIFRRNLTQIKNPGGLWDEATKVYSNVLGDPNQSSFQFTFPSGMKIKFGHLEYNKNAFDWQGSQIPYIGFDELTHFTEFQFFYMLSRNRSTSGAKAYVRATTNPDADSWVRKLIDWYIDENGYPIKERAGVLRYFVRIDDEIHWADTKEDLIQKFGEKSEPKSFTFIPAKLEDNKILMEKDPSYLANLMALPRVERARLLDGNWNVKPTAGSYFQRGWFRIVEAVPSNLKTIRYWDRAASEKEGAAFTVGLKLGISDQNEIYVLDVERGQWSPHGVQNVITNTASRDGKSVIIGIEKDPGQAGVVEAQMYVNLLLGYVVKLNPAIQDKETRAMPISAQCEAGNVRILKGTWNEAFLNELQNFPVGKLKDQVDAFSGAFNLLAAQRTGQFTKSMASPSIKGSNSKGDQW